MILTAGVDHQFDRLIGELLDERLDGRGAFALPPESSSIASLRVNRPWETRGIEDRLVVLS
ncbi:MAG: hypothetical protein K9L82_19095 [Chromatiaceae bacterium]|nr:hypothetical protein [Chromatiaceae bacterium]MCF7997228.1 hypothetical protein [Chromatiaceae bacterium]